MYRSSFLLLAIAATVLFVPLSRAQFLDQGALTGTIQDASGAVIPGAQVTLVNTDTSFKLTTKSNNAGVYVFSPIKIGRYSLTATAPGFQQTTQQNISVTLGQRSNVSVTLRAGSVDQTVTVTEAPPLLQSQDSSAGQTLTSQEINDTPLNGRNAVYLVQLTPGSVPSNGSRARGNGDFNANGLRAEQNNFVLDGMDNNSVTVDYLNAASYVINPPPDALAQFKVSTANYSAEYGHSAGAVVNASIKSGTNKIHGSLWEYWRNDILNAHDWLLPKDTPNSKYRENQFGGTLGFPIIKDHLFFFGDAQANRIAQSVAQGVASVPTVKERNGDFSELLDTSLISGSVPIKLYEPHNNQVLLKCNGQQNVLCRDQISPVAQKILNMYPLPSPGVQEGKTYQNYFYSLSQPQNTFQWDTRVDWDINSTDQMFARFSYLNSRGENAAPLGPILDGGGGNGSKNQSGTQIDYGNNFVISETHIFTPRLVNEFRIGYVYGHFDILNPGYSNPGAAASLGLGGVPSGPDFPDNGGLPTTNIGSIMGFGAHQYRPEKERENEYQILDNVSWTLGSHSLRLGFSYQSIRSATLEPPASHPIYNFTGAQTAQPGVANTGNGVADFLTDNMQTGSLGPSGYFNDAQYNVSGYVQDDWKAARNLTLNLGVRYDFFQPYKEMAGRQANFYATSTGIGTGTAVYVLPAQNQGKLALNPKFLDLLAANNIELQYDSNPSLSKAQHYNFAPRVGFALTTDPRTVFRGGFGIFYQGQQQGGAAVNLGTNYPFVFSNNFLSPSCPKGSANCANNGYDLENGFSAAVDQGLINFFSTPGLVGQSRDLKTTYAMDYNLAFEEAFSNDFVATIGYVGTMSRHLPVSINTNSSNVLLPSGSDQKFLPFPGFTGASDLLYIGVSEYNALQTKVQKRISHGLDFLATYTWAHSMDNAAEPLGGGIGYRNTAIIPIHDEMTNSSWDTRHRFTFNGFYRLPFGRGQAHLNHSSYLVDALLGGWSTNITYQLQSGQPFTVGTANQSNVVGGSARAVRVGNPFAPGGSANNTNPSIPCASTTRTKEHWFNPCAYENPLPASLLTPFGHCPDPTVACDPGKYPYPTYVTDEATAKLFLGDRGNQIYGPGFQRMDMSVFKHFRTYESQYLEIRADCFNVMNTPAWAQPNGGIGKDGGQITNARSVQVNTPNVRFFQLSAKYEF